MAADDDGFVGAKLDNQKGDHGFDACAYSFFGEMGDVDGGLEEALEEGLEAPPEEELPEDPALLLDVEEDLSYASMFMAALDAGNNDMSFGGHHQAFGFGAEGSSTAAKANDVSSGTPGGSLFQDFQISTDLMNPTPPRPKQLGSIALGGLLAAGTPCPSFGSASNATPFGGFGSSGMPTPQQQMAQQPSPLQDPAIVHMGGTPPHVVASLQAGPGPIPLRHGRAVTAQELETQLLGGGSQQEQQQQQRGGGEGAGMPPPPQQGPPYAMGMAGAMGMPPLGMLPPGMQHNSYPPLQHHMGGPPSGYGMPSGTPMQGMQSMQASPPPQGHMQGGQPPARPIPMQQPGMLGGPPPEIQHSPVPPLGYGPPPPMQQQQQTMMGRPRGPPPDFGPRMFPGPPGGVPPHVGPSPPGPWAHRPPMNFPGLQQQRPQPGPQQPHPHATLAQRLRALNLADHHEEMRRPVLRRRYSSQYMDHEEIEHILHIQWRALHGAAPYLEDYYYQAFLYKYYARRNRRTFAPESVRELAPTEKMAPGEVAFVKVEGLGRLPFSNIRRPRPLMDVAPGELRDGKGEGKEGANEEEEGAVRPLDQEPMLAARIMIEDCMCLLLDVLDIDQIFVAAAGGPVENERALRTRRMLLMDGLAASLRLPEGAVVAPPTPGAAAHGGDGGDGVFLRLMSVTKGKKLLARALRVIYPTPEAAQPTAWPRSTPTEGELAAPAAPPQHPNLRIMWAALRSLRFLFAGHPGHTEDALASAAVAAAAAEVLRRLHSPQAVADGLAAVLHGDLDGTPLLNRQPGAVLMPLYAPGTTAQDAQLPWLVDVLTALLQRAAELDLLPSTVPPDGAESAAATWRAHLPRLYALVERHVGALHEAFQAGLAMGEKEAAAEVKALVPISLVRVLLPHCTKEQVQVLRGYLKDLGV